MAILKFVTKNAEGSAFTEKYKDDDALEQLTGYAINYEKTCDYVGGWAVDSKNAAYEMKLLSALYHKDNGVRLRHWIISLTWYEAEAISEMMKLSEADALCVLGYQLSAYYKDSFQVIFGVHFDKQYSPHIHFVMNSVSYKDGTKYTGGRDDYYNYQRYITQTSHPVELQLRR